MIRPKQLGACLKLTHTTGFLSRLKWDLYGSRLPLYLETNLYDSLACLQAGGMGDFPPRKARNGSYQSQSVAASKSGKYHCIPGPKCLKQALVNKMPLLTPLGNLSMRASPFLEGLFAFPGKLTLLRGFGFGDSPQNLS